MIARELLVKLGFNIDEKKLDRFSNNIEKMKSQVQDLRTKIHSSIKPTLEVGKFIAQKDKVEKQLQKDVSLPQKLGGNISAIKAQMQDLRQKIALNIEPNSNVDQLIAYKKELQELSTTERKDIEELNRQENLRAKADIKRNRQKLRDLTAIKAKLQETNTEFKRAATAAKNANQTFSRFFSRFAFAAIGGIGLNIRSTLKDAKEFKEGKVNKASGGFTKEQINSVDRFNSTLMQTRRITSGIRNNLVTELLPSIKEYLDMLNKWLLDNKELIKLRFNEFISSVTKSIKVAIKAFKNFYNVLDPLVQLIGGWSTILTGFIGAGILSWVVRFGVFIGKATGAIWVFAKSFRVFQWILFRSPIVLAISGIVAALTLLSDTFKDVKLRGGVIDSLKKVSELFDKATTKVNNFLEAISSNKHGTQLFPKDVEPNDADLVHTTEKGLKVYKARKRLKKFNGEVQEFKKKVDDRVKNFTTDNGLELSSVSNPIKNFQPRTLSPNTVAKGNNIQNRNVINIRNNINLSVILIEGTTEKQAREITTLVEEKLRENNAQNNLETLNAIGAY